MWQGCKFHIHPSSSILPSAFNYQLSAATTSCRRAVSRRRRWAGLRVAESHWPFRARYSDCDGRCIRFVSTILTVAQPDRFFKKRPYTWRACAARNSLGSLVRLTWRVRNTSLMGLIGRLWNIRVAQAQQSSINFIRGCRIALQSRISGGLMPTFGLACRGFCYGRAIC